MVKEVLPKTCGLRQGLDVVAHNFNPACRRQREADGCEFEASLIDTMSVRPAWTI